MGAEDTAAVAPPEGEYAIVEVMGHRTLVGRVAEIERFGTKFLTVEPIWQDALLPPVLIGGASIYQMTPCAAAIAFKRQPREHYQLPPSIAVTVPKPEPMLTFDGGEAEAETACGHEMGSCLCDDCTPF